MKTFATAVALVAAAASPAVFAFDDPAGDLLPGFTGAPSPALDLLSSSVQYDPSTQSFALRATTAGAIAGVPGLAFAFGFDRGGPVNAPFGPIGFPGVQFNSVVSLRGDGTGVVGAAPVAVLIDGTTISATVPAALLPGNGRTPEQFTWALWTQDLAVAGLARNADFGPTANIPVSTVPEPGTWALLAGGLGVLLRRSRRRG